MANFVKASSGFWINADPDDILYFAIRPWGREIIQVTFKVDPTNPHVLNIPNERFVTAFLESAGVKQ